MTDQQEKLAAARSALKECLQSNRGSWSPKADTLAETLACEMLKAGRTLGQALRELTELGVSEKGAEALIEIAAKRVGTPWPRALDRIDKMERPRWSRLVLLGLAVFIASILLALVLAGAGVEHLLGFVAFLALNVSGFGLTAVGAVMCIRQRGKLRGIGLASVIFAICAVGYGIPFASYCLGLKDFQTSQMVLMDYFLPSGLAGLGASALLLPYAFFRGRGRTKVMLLSALSAALLVTFGVCYVIESQKLATLLWQAKIEDLRGGPFAVGDCVVYSTLPRAAADSAIYCVDLRTGSLRWKQGGGRFFGWPHNAAETPGGGILVGSQVRLMVLSKDDGREKWRVTVPYGKLFSSSAAVGAGKVFVETTEVQPRWKDLQLVPEYLQFVPEASTKEVTLWCLDVQDGRVLWNFSRLVDSEEPDDTDERVRIEMLARFHSPVYGGGRVWFMAGGELYGLDPEDGKCKYQYVFQKDVPEGWVVGIEGPLVFLALPDGKAVAYNVDSREVAWHFESGSSLSAIPVHGPGVLCLFMTAGQVVGLDSLTGKRKWQTSFSPFHSLPPIRAAAKGDNAWVTVVTHEGCVVLDSTTGARVWFTPRSIEWPTGATLKNGVLCYGDDLCGVVRAFAVPAER